MKEVLQNQIVFHVELVSILVENVILHRREKKRLLPSRGLRGTKQAWMRAAAKRGGGGTGTSASERRPAHRGGKRGHAAAPTGWANIRIKLVVKLLGRCGMMKNVILLLLMKMKY